MLELGEVQQVRVPARVDGLAFTVPVDGDQLDSGLDQPPGHQHALSEGVVAVAPPLFVGDAGEVEGVPGPGREHHVEGTLVELVERLARVGSIGQLRGAVDSVQQSPPPGHSTQPNALGQLQALDREVTPVGVLVDPERIEPPPQHPATLARSDGTICGVDHLGQCDEGRQAVLVGLQVAEHRAEVGEVGLASVEGLLLQLVLAAGQSGVCTGRVVVVFLADGADDRQLVGVLRDQRQVFGDVQAGNVGPDRTEFASRGDRPVWFHVPGVLVSRATPHEQQDHSLGTAEGPLVEGCCVGG